MSAQHLSPTKAIMQFRIASLEKQVKEITSKHNLVAQQVSALLNDHVELAARCMITEQLLMEKFGLTPEDIQRAALRVQDLTKRVEAERKLDGAKIECATAEAPASDPTAEADDTLIGDESAQAEEAKPAPPSEPVDQPAPVFHAV